MEAEEPINVALDMMSHFSQETYERIKLFVEKSDEAMLREVIEYAHNVSIARIFIDALLGSGKRPAVWLLEKFASNMGKEEIKSYAMKLKDVGASEEALKICHEWVSDLINRSYVYYDDAIDVLGTMKRVCDEAEWRAYSSAFREANKGKRKLMEKMRSNDLV